MNVDANLPADGYHYSLENSENGTSISEKPFIPALGTNTYPFQPYFDDPQNHMQKRVTEEQVSQSNPEMKLMEY
jgi:hypothetical protein